MGNELFKYGLYYGILIPLFLRTFYNTAYDWKNDLITYLGNQEIIFLNNKIYYICKYRKLFRHNIFPTKYTRFRVINDRNDEDEEEEDLFRLYINYGEENKKIFNVRNNLAKWLRNELRMALRIINIK